MSRLRALCRDRRGMTLVEIMTSFAILAILLAVSLSMMLFSSKVLANDASRDRMKMRGDELYTALSKELTFATHIQVLDGLEGAKYENVFFVKDGYLYYGPTAGPYALYYPADIYEGTALSLTAVVAGDDALTLALTLTKDAEPVYKTTSSLKLPNLTARTDAVRVEGTGIMENPVICYNGVPYKIEEGATPETSTPYTVACYPTEKAELVRELEDAGVYNSGDIVLYEGEYWQVPAQKTIVYFEELDFHGTKNSAWKSLNASWRKCDYDKYDVVMGEGETYFLSLLDLNQSPFTNRNSWRQVYWFEEHSRNDRTRGWSLTEDAYTSVYPVT